MVGDADSQNDIESQKIWYFQAYPFLPAAQVPQFKSIFSPMP